MEVLRGNTAIAITANANTDTDQPDTDIVIDMIP
jgi:hypothetical protein